MRQPGGGGGDRLKRREGAGPACRSPRSESPRLHPSARPLPSRLAVVAVVHLLPRVDHHHHVPHHKRIRGRTAAVSMTTGRTPSMPSPYGGGRPMRTPLPAPPPGRRYAYARASPLTSRRPPRAAHRSTRPRHSLFLPPLFFYLLEPVVSDEGNSILSFPHAHPPSRVVGTPRHVGPHSEGLHRFFSPPPLPRLPVFFFCLHLPLTP